MAWIRIDDGFADHPKIIRAGPIALVIQVRALCWSSRHLTDGFIPDEAVEGLLTGFRGIGMDTSGGPGFALGRDVSDFHWHEIMVANGLWHAAKGGYMIHDFLAYNPSKADIFEMRDKKVTAGKIGASKRWNGRGNSTTIARAIPSASALPSESLCPPSPSPTPKDKDLKTYMSDFSQFWTSYPKKQGIGKCRDWFTKNKPDRSLLEKMLAKIEEGKKSEQWKKDNGQFIPMPVTWLNQGRWEDQFEINVDNKTKPSVSYHNPAPVPSDGDIENPPLDEISDFVRKLS